MNKLLNMLSTGIFQPILPLTLMCNSVILDAAKPLLVAILGPGPCFPALLGLAQPRPTRALLMVMCTLECAQDSNACLK
jgi:hypothetical protein